MSERGAFPRERRAETVVGSRAETDEDCHSQFGSDLSRDDEEGGPRWQLGECDPGGGESEDDQRDRKRAANADGRVFQYRPPLGRSPVNDQRVPEVGHTVDVVDSRHEIDADDEQKPDRRRRSGEQQRRRDQRAENVAREREGYWGRPERLPRGVVVTDGKPREESQGALNGCQSHATTPARRNETSPAIATTRTPRRAPETVGSSAFGFNT